MHATTLQLLWVGFNYVMNMYISCEAFFSSNLRSLLNSWPSEKTNKDEGQCDFEISAFFTQRSSECSAEENVLSGCLPSKNVSLSWFGRRPRSDSCVQCRRGRWGNRSHILTRPQTKCRSHSRQQQNLLSGEAWRQQRDTSASFFEFSLSCGLTAAGRFKIGSPDPQNSEMQAIVVTRGEGAGGGGTDTGSKTRQLWHVTGEAALERLTSNELKRGENDTVKTLEPRRRNNMQNLEEWQRRHLFVCWLDDVKDDLTGVTMLKPEELDTGRQRKQEEGLRTSKSGRRK